MVEKDRYVIIKGRNNNDKKFYRLLHYPSLISASENYTGFFSLLSLAKDIRSKKKNKELTNYLVEDGSSFISDIPDDLGQSSFINPIEYDFFQFIVEGKTKK